MSEFAGQYQIFLGFQLIASMVTTSNLRFFFLSHCHTDHMVGLNEPGLFERLKDYNLKNYCHKVSAALLSACRFMFI